MGQDAPPLFTREEYLAAVCTLQQRNRRGVWRAVVFPILGLGWMAAVSLVYPRFPDGPHPAVLGASIALFIAAYFLYHNMRAWLSRRRSGFTRRYGSLADQVQLTQVPERLFGFSRVNDPTLMSASFHAWLLRVAETKGPAGFLEQAYSLLEYLIYDPWACIDQPAPSKPTRKQIAVLILLVALLVALIAGFVYYQPPDPQSIWVGLLFAALLPGLIGVLFLGGFVEYRTRDRFWRVLNDRLSFLPQRTASVNDSSGLATNSALVAVLRRIRFDNAIAANYLHRYTALWFNHQTSPELLLTIMASVFVCAVIGSRDALTGMLILTCMIASIFLTVPLLRIRLRATAQRLRECFQASGLAADLFTAELSATDGSASFHQMACNPLLGRSDTNWLPREIARLLYTRYLCSLDRTSRILDGGSETAYFVMAMGTLAGSFAYMISTYDNGDCSTSLAAAWLFSGLAIALTLARIAWQYFFQRNIVWKRGFLRYLQDYADSLPPVAP